MEANLIENAIRHCPEGAGIKVTGALEGGDVVLTFADNGPSIPVSEHENVFQRLLRLEKGRTTLGSSLDLSMVKVIADPHGAKIMLAERISGLTIRVAFPNVSRT